MVEQDLRYFNNGKEVDKWGIPIGPKSNFSHSSLSAKQKPSIKKDKEHSLLHKEKRNLQNDRQSNPPLSLKSTLNEMVKFVYSQIPEAASLQFRLTNDTIQKNDVIFVLQKLDGFLDNNLFLSFTKEARSRVLKSVRFLESLRIDFDKGE